MKEIIWKPELHRFRSCKEFVEEFRLGASDLILTNEYIYQPYFGAMNLECTVLYQEQYGMGEPTDVMAEAILRDAAATGWGGAHPAARGGAALRGICDELFRRGVARGGVQRFAYGDAVYQAVRV